MVWTDLQNVRFSNDSGIRMFGIRIPTVVLLCWIIRVHLIKYCKIGEKFMVGCFVGCQPIGDTVSVSLQSCWVDVPKLKNGMRWYHLKWQHWEEAATWKYSHFQPLRGSCSTDHLLSFCEKSYIECNFIKNYSGDLNSKLVRYSNGAK